MPIKQIFDLSFVFCNLISISMALDGLELESGSCHDAVATSREFVEIKKGEPVKISVKILRLPILFRHIHYHNQLHPLNFVNRDTALQ